MDRPPVAHAGDDKKVVAKSAFTLDGSASQDPEGKPLTYHWVQIGGPTVTLTDADKAKASVAGNRPKSMVSFRLTVTDPSGHTDTDEVVISPK